MRRLDPLIGIVLLGLALRLCGLRWGLPCAAHVFSYHPDEAMLAGAAMAANPLLGDFTTSFYNYGSFIPLLLRIAADVLGVLIPVPPEDWALAARLHLVGRVLTVLFGTATLVVVYGMGRRLARLTGVARAQPGKPATRERLAGLVAAGVLAITPMHVAHSHYLTVDVPAAFWVAASLSAALSLLEAPRLRMALLAGACAGLAAATKYNAGLVILAAPVALALQGSLSRRQQAAGQTASDAGAEATSGKDEDPAAGEVPATAARRRVRAALALGCLGAAAAAFLAACPGVVLETPKFWHDFQFELNHVRTGHGLVFQGTPPAWLYHLITSLRFGLGVPLLALLLAALLPAVWRRSPADLVVAAWVVPYYLVIGMAQVKFMRYALPLVPVLIAWAAVVWADWLAGACLSRARSLAAAGLVAAGLWTAGSAVTYTALFAVADPRDRAAAWIRGTLPPGSSVALTTVPWFYTPPLVPLNGGPLTQDAFERQRPRWPYAFQVGGWTADRLLAQRPHCFIASNLEEQIRDGLRLDLPETRALVMALERYYRKEVFAPLATWPGLFGPGYPPEDWVYPAPTIAVYVHSTP